MSVNFFLDFTSCLISVFNLQSLKFIDLRKTPSLEIGMMMVFCYAPYALAEGLHLSGMNSFIFATNFTTNFQSHSLNLATNFSTNLPKSFTWITKKSFINIFPLTGIMSILFCGVVMSHYTHLNLSPVSQITVQQLFRTISFIAGK